MYDVEQLEHAVILECWCWQPQKYGHQLTFDCLSSSVTQILIIWSAVNKLCYSFHIIFPPDYQLITSCIWVFLLVNQSDQTDRNTNGSNL
jgi:hypothetical protein